MRKCREAFEDAKNRFGVAQVAANKVNSDTKTTKEEAFMFEADYVAGVGKWREGVGG